MHGIHRVNKIFSYNNRYQIANFHIFLDFEESYDHVGRFKQKEKAKSILKILFIQRKHILPGAQ